MPQIRVRRQRQLFEQQPAAPAACLPPDVQAQLRQVLVHWLQALAKAIHEQESGDE